MEQAGIKNQALDDACREILKYIKPGDVVNQTNKAKWWEIFLAIGIWGIVRYQRHLFGKKSRYHDDHNMLFLSKDQTLSVEPPKAVLKPLKKYCLTDISIYRLTKHTIDDEDIKIMQEAAKPLLGTQYDIGQLVDILINGLLGFEHQVKFRFFDFGKKKKVCSVGIRAVFEYLYQKRIKSTADNRIWLFKKINPDYWSEHIVNNFKGVDVEATTPAHFANSEYFDNEFTLIAKFNKGKRIYPLEDEHL